MTLNRALPWIALAALLALPLVLTPYTHDLVVKIMVLSVFALSLELLVGMTGLVSLGHAAFLGIGAYVTVLLSPEADPGWLPKLLLAAVGAVDTFGKVFFAELSGIGVYLLMALILIWRPEGLMKRAG